MGSCLAQAIRTKRLTVASLRPPGRMPRLRMSPGSISGVALSVRGCQSHEDPSRVYTLRSYLAQKVELFSSRRFFFLCVCVSSAVPIDSTAGIKMLYVFVDIQMDNVHFLDTVKFNFPPGQSLALVSTIQFVAALQVTKLLLTYFGLCVPFGT